MSATLFCVCLFAGQAAPDTTRQKEIDARWWFNNPVFRLNDHRRVLLFFFECEGKENSTWIPKLNRLAKRPDIVLIGLTKEDNRRAEQYMKRMKIEFTVGAGSRCSKTFGIRRMPALLSVDRTKRSETTVSDVDALDTAVPAWRESIAGIDDEITLVQCVDSNAETDLRAYAIDKLWAVLERKKATADFAELADALLPAEGDPFIRGQLRYYRDKAQGVQRKDRDRSASTEVYRNYRDDPDDPKWAVVHSYTAEMTNKTPSQLLEDYRYYQTDEPSDLVIRRLIIETMTHKVMDSKPTDEYRVAARSAFMDMLTGEPDHSCRLFATMGLTSACEVGDTEAADFLESLAKSETNDFTVRPTMEVAAKYLRTGEGGPGPADRLPGK